ncbi:anion exchange protein 2 isoform X2 [Daktulosphaira vitifoliae]|uniref:anion exchange protein 2 isoform X2 n=1 Tax=Daktulosphaira vitifoliae TaxID=58002 RepID=UPI0021AA3FD9|nr:anion exchange protein 2 isoform X2 [Daktulosphaira vitifoliae]
MSSNEDKDISQPNTSFGLINLQDEHIKSLNDESKCHEERNLDEEMERVFAGVSSEGDASRFDLSKFDGGRSPKPDDRRLSEDDFIVHRNNSRPHVHIPLKSIAKSKRKKSTTSLQIKDSDTENLNKFEDEKYITDSDSAMSPPTTSRRTSSNSGETHSLMAGNGNHSVEIESDGLLSSECETPMYEPPHFEHYFRQDSADKRVQFNIDEKNEDEAIIEHRELDQTQVNNHHNSVKKKKHKHRHHHHNHNRLKYSEREVFIPKDLQMEENLDEFVQDDLTSHRYDCGKEKRRFSGKNKNSLIASYNGDLDRNLIAGLPVKILKKYIDHSPHEVFVQLDELKGNEEDREWKETARWIKYEEDVEEGTDRWGRPHVASLSFHSLLNVRRSLESGVILLDLEENNLPGIIYRVVEQMAVEELINTEDKAAVMRLLLLRHRHVQQDGEKFSRFIRRNTASYSSLTSFEAEILAMRSASLTNNNLNDDVKLKIKNTLSHHDVHSSPKNNFTNNNNINVNQRMDLLKNHTAIDMKEETYTSSVEDMIKRVQKESILKRIPFGAEATTVLVGSVDFLKKRTAAFVRLAEGIIIPSLTEVTIPVRFMFILLGPSDPKDIDYHEVGRSMSTLMSNSEFHCKAYKATERKELISLLNEFLDSSIVLPPCDWEREELLSLRELKEKSEQIKKRKIHAAFQKISKVDEHSKKEKDDPLKRTKKPWGGLVKDIKRRFPFYMSDFTDGINLQCIAGAIFIYFAALSAAITFGGLLADKTKNMIGISETLVATSLAGVIFSLLSGQPLLIIGTTGPLLLFDESLFNFCQDNNIDFLAMRLYVGIWLAVISLLVSCVEGSVLVKVFTRFTEEIFSSLISLIYIWESLSKCLNVFSKHPLLSVDKYCTEDVITQMNSPIFSKNSSFNNSLMKNATENINQKINPQLPINQPNTALLCTILALGTFFIAYYLRHFRNSKFLGRSIRRALGDFGVPIAIVSMVATDYFNPSTYTEKLSVPEGLKPSNASVRGWLISPNGLEGHIDPWLPFIAIVPALLVYILAYMETHISELIINKKERKLKKGSGFHLDIVLVNFINMICGLIGAPWMSAATVRSVAHVAALTIMSQTHAPGQKPHIIEVKEQRVSSLLVSMMVGGSVLMAPLLRLIPMAVLFGVFLYMGISSIDGIQFFERLKLIFMPVKYHSDATFVRNVQTYKMHLFTAIQLMCLCTLWIVKSSSLSLLFPFFLIMMIPVRSQLCDRLFTFKELRALDSNELPDKTYDEDEPDFYTESRLPG